MPQISVKSYFSQSSILKVQKSALLGLGLHLHTLLEGRSKGVKGIHEML